MNRKNLIGFLIVLLMVTSGPLYLPLAVASATAENATQTTEEEVNPTIDNVVDEANATENKPVTVIILEPVVSASADTDAGSSPFFVSFKGNVSYSHLAGGVLIYKWDFDGDGCTDYASFETGDVTHVYLAETEQVYDAVFTVNFKNGLSKSSNVQVQISPVDPQEWLHIESLGYTKFGFKADGTIAVFDEKDWIILNPSFNGVLLKSPSYSKTNEMRCKLAYKLETGELSIDVEYGLAGRARFRVSASDQSGKAAPTTGFQLQAQNGIVEKGRLDFKTDFKQAGSGNTLVTDGGNHEPWTDQGLVPYGEYFSNIDSFVATETGYLTIIQGDLHLPGRGLDLTVKRVYAPPNTYEGSAPATKFDYSYQDYPWAPMGNGWQLGFPWIEHNASGPTYIRLGEGQRYKYEGAGLSGTEYHSGDHFKLYSFTNGNYTLYTVDGVRYCYDQEYKLIYIKDPSKNNVITFTYSQEDKITRIDDTVGRSVYFSYNQQGYLSSVTSGPRVISYLYEAGQSQGARLVEVRDPLERSTKFSYYTDYLVNRTEYPTGAYVEYDYASYVKDTYTRYRVTDETTREGPASQASLKHFTYVCDFDQVDQTKIQEHYGGSGVLKTTQLDYSQSQYSEKKWNGTETDQRFYWLNKLLNPERRRIEIEYYPGESASEELSIYAYDNWGDLIFSRDYEGHDTYYSYENTDTTDAFKDSNGVQYQGFTDSFYSNTVNPSIHICLVGRAEHQNGPGTLTLEQYFKYDVDGNLVESKRLHEDSWVMTLNRYDDYGNLVRVTDPNDHRTFYEYNSTYQYAYLTKTKQLLEGLSDLNLTSHYRYNFTTGQLKRSTSANGTTTGYMFDMLGRVVEVVNPATAGTVTTKQAVYHDDLNTVELFDENGNRNVKHFDGLNRLVRVERFNGSVSYSNETWAYNWQGLVQGYVDAEGDEHNYYYDALGNLIKTVNPDGSSSKTVRNYNGNSLTVYDEEDRRRQLQYDAVNRLVSVREYYDASSYYLTEYAYDGVGNLKIVEDSLGRSTTYYFDQFNRPVHVHYPDGKWERNIYDGVDNVVTRFNRNGTCIQYEYDSLNQMVNETCYQTNITCSISEDEAWLAGWEHRKAINITGTQAGSKTNYQIMFEVYFGSGTDSSNRVYLYGGCQADFDDIRFTRSNGVTTLDHWRGYRDANMAVFWVEVNSIPASPDSTTIYIYYGNPMVSSTSNGANTFKEFDDIESYTNGDTLPFGDWVVNDVDYTVKVSTTRAWEESKSIYAYDPGPNRNIFYWNIDDIESGSHRFHCAFYVESYGDLHTKPLVPLENNRIINVIYENGTVEYYDGSYHTICAGVSADEWHTMEICFAVGGSTFDICLDGVWYYNLNQEHRNGDTDPHYIEVTSTGLDQTVKAYFDAYFVGKYADPEPQITSYGGAEAPQQKIEYSKYWVRRLLSTLYEYDDLSNPTSSSYNGTSAEWRYDARNRLIRETFNVQGSVYTVNYGYDGVGNVVELVYPDSSALSMEYDFANRLRTVGGVASLTYTLTDKVGSIVYGNGVVSSYSYDDRDRPTNVLTVNGAVVLQNLTIMYDDSGSIASIGNGTYTESYGYDQLDRLTSSTGPWGSLSYTYDSVGNRLSLNRGGSVTSYTYDSVDRIASATGMGFTWDDNGNLLTWDDGSNDWAYRYDSMDRLINVKENGVASARYTYDASGRRVRSWDAAGTTDYVYSGLNVIDEVRGGVHEKHVYAGSMHLASVSSGTVEYYHVDHLGSTRLKTNSTGGVVYESNYEPYGPEYGESGNEEFRYTGKQEDPTGLYYFGARYYDPVTGRFITRDSVFGDLSDPQSLNRYSYCRNNPHKYTDPDGECPIVIGAVTGAIISGGFYYLTHRNNFDETEFTAAIISGAITGALTGGLSGINVVSTQVVTRLGAAMTSWSLTNVAEHMIGKDISQDPIEIVYDVAIDTGLSYGINKAAIGANVAELLTDSQTTREITKNIVDKTIKAVSKPIVKVTTIEMLREIREFTIRNPIIVTPLSYLSRSNSSIKEWDYIEQRKGV